MTLDRFLEALQILKGGWVESQEGYLRRFVEAEPINGVEAQWDFPITAVARLLGCPFPLIEGGHFQWQRASVWLGLSPQDAKSIVEADQNFSSRRELRLELERRIGLSEDRASVIKALELKDRENQLHNELLPPWAKEPGKESQQIKDYLKKLKEGG